MIPVVNFPTIVEKYAPYFEGVFSAEAFIQFKRYISGLILSENKSIEGMNRLFVHESRNQSSLNRLLTESPYSITELNECRLKLLESIEGTKVKEKGVLSIDDTLLTHYGRHFDKIAYLYDSTEKKYAWAHNLVTLHYSDDQTDYPVMFELWEPVELDKLEKGLQEANIQLKESKFKLKESQPAQWRQYILGVWRRNRHKDGIEELYDSKMRIAERLCEQWWAMHPDQKLPVTFDSWYTQPTFCHFFDKAKQPYIGALAEDKQVHLKTGLLSLADFGKRLKAEHLAAVESGQPPVFQATTINYKGETETYYCYCGTHRVHNYGKVRLLISHRRADLSDNPIFLISNRRVWQAKGMVRIYRHRWPVEVYHEEGKAEGLDQYQLRDFNGIIRHIALVALVYSLLRAAQHDSDLQQSLQRELKFELEGSAPFWRRATQAQTLWNLALFISSGLAHGKQLHDLMQPLLNAVCPR